MTERQSTREQRLEAALRDVRNKGIVAGAAVMARAPDWRERVTEVLDIIDAALAIPPDADVPADEAELRKMMRDPRYWRAREPDFVRRVTEGFRKLVESDDGKR